MAISASVQGTHAVTCIHIKTHSQNTYTRTHTYTLLCNVLQVSCQLSSIVLFDTLSLDFEISEALLVTFGGQTRALSSYAAPKEGVAWQLKQRLSPSEKLQVKVHLSSLLDQCSLFILCNNVVLCYSYKLRYLSYYNMMLYMLCNLLSLA